MSGTEDKSEEVKSAEEHGGESFDPTETPETVADQKEVKPGDCVDCNGDGLRSDGRLCATCEGTGKA